MIEIIFNLLKFICLLFVIVVIASTYVILKLVRKGAISENEMDRIIFITLVSIIAVPYVIVLFWR